ncbi:MAG: TolC family protein, partial [Spirochaetales bacterium]|nr:TolC family protein [Spirochaetales bacterium]
MKKKVLVLLYIISLSVYVFPNENSINIFNVFTALENYHPQFSINAKTAEAEAQKKQILMAGNPWHFFITPYNNLYSGLSAQQFKADTADYAGIQMGIINPRLDTGGSIAFSMASQLEFLTNPSVEAAPFSYKNNMELQYIQPLINNNYVTQTAFSLSEQEMENEIVLLSIKDAQKQLYFYTADLFMNWLYLSEAREVLSERISISRDLLEKLKKQFKAGLIDRIDIIRSEDSLRSTDLLYSQIN